MSSRSMATRPVRRPTAMSMVLDVPAVRSWLPPPRRNCADDGEQARDGERLEEVARAGLPPAEVRPPARRARRTRLGVPRCGAMVVLT